MAVVVVPYARVRPAPSRRTGFRATVRLSNPRECLPPLQVPRERPPTDRTDSRSRRSTLRPVGATAGVALAAGCTEGTGDGEGDQNESDETVTDEADEDDPDPPEDDKDEWADVPTLEFEADTDGWIGIEPEAIEDEENPDIALYEGREYDSQLWLYFLYHSQL
ncbi:hypothetical protein [Natronococcus roseus]|uniref:hypothetical protein n=1 Tax=Natronococcus roseus TaxID=1052014 RepID=UPI00374C9B92